MIEEEYHVTRMGASQQTFEDNQLKMKESEEVFLLLKKWETTVSVV